MPGFILNIIYFLFEGASAAGGSAFDRFWQEYMNNPQFPLWKFVNLAIFAGLLIYLIKKPLSESFKAKREEIRAELIKAEEEKQAAMARLTEIEAKNARLESEKNEIILKSQVEADNEAKRIAEQTESDLKKMHLQAEAEIARSRKQAENDLRKFSAEESIRLAEEMIKGKLSGARDSDLVKVGINSIGGAK